VDLPTPKVQPNTLTKPPRSYQFALQSFEGRSFSSQGRLSRKKRQVDLDIDLTWLGEYNKSLQKRFPRIFRVGEMPTSRIEAFSDGVFAIIITLLVLEIHVPQVQDKDISAALEHSLLAMTPKFLSSGGRFSRRTSRCDVPRHSHDSRRSEFLFNALLRILRKQAGR
jgi:hypothetical protein